MQLTACALFISLVMCLFTCHVLGFDVAVSCENQIKHACHNSSASRKSRRVGTVPCVNIRPFPLMSVITYVCLFMHKNVFRCAPPASNPLTSSTLAKACLT